MVTQIVQYLIPENDIMTAIVLVAAFVLADRVQAQFPAAPLDRKARLIELMKKENALRHPTFFPVVSIVWCTSLNEVS